MHRDRRRLVLIRHGESQANASNRFTGTSESELTAKGIYQMRDVGQQLAALNIIPDRFFCSALNRTRESARILAEETGTGGCSVIADAALNERDYGDLTSLSKDDAATRWGDEQVLQWRRSYDAVPPGGESLRDTVARVLPYYVRCLLPAAMAGGNTFVVAHGNSLRALIMALEGITVQDIPAFQLPTGATVVFTLSDDTRVCRSGGMIVPLGQTWV
jgi:2,3-bisphosphoglycerate-dependent phosphoglycerate mutase